MHASRSVEARNLLTASANALRQHRASDAAVAARQAVHLARQGALPAIEGAARVNLGEALRATGQTAEAIAELRKAIQLLPEDGAKHALSDAHSNLGLALLDCERWSLALPSLEKAEQLKSELGDVAGHAITVKLQAIAHGQLGAVDLCLARMHQSAELFEAAGDLREALRCLDSVSDRVMAPERYLDLLDCLRHTLRLSTRLSDVARIASGLAALGALVGLQAGDAKQGAEFLEQATELAEACALDDAVLGGVTRDQARSTARYLRDQAAHKAAQRAFLDERYDECAALVLGCSHTTTTAIALALISVRRSTGVDAAVRLFPRHASDARAWEAVLLKIAVGLPDDDDAEALVGRDTTPEMRAQFHYYFAELGRSLGESESATRALQRCLAEPADCAEQALAAELIDRIDGGCLALRRLWELARLSQVRGDAMRAVQLAMDAIAMSEARFGAGSTESANSHETAGMIFQMQSNFTRSRAHLEAALQALRSSRGEARDLGALHHMLARSCSNLGDRAAAEVHYKTAIAILEHSRGPTAGETLTSIDNLAYLYEEQGDLPAARAQLDRVLEARLCDPGPEAEDTLRSMDAMAGLLEKQDDLAGALHWLERASEARRTSLGAGHLHTMQTDVDVLRLQCRLGHWADAEQLAAELEAAWSRAATRDLIAQLVAARDVCQRGGAHRAAVGCARIMLRLAERVYGPNHEQTLTAAGNLSYDLLYTREYTEAEALGVRVLEERERTLGKRHPSYTLSLNNLSQLYQCTGRVTQALDALKQVVEIESATGEITIATAGNHINLAHASWTLGHAAEARHHFLCAVEILRERYPEGCEHLAAALDQLSTMALGFGDIEQAKEHLGEAIAVLENASASQDAEHRSRTVKLRLLGALSDPRCPVPDWREIAASTPITHRLAIENRILAIDALLRRRDMHAEAANALAELESSLATANDVRLTDLVTIDKMRATVLLHERAFEPAERAARDGIARVEAANASGLPAYIDLLKLLGLAQAAQHKSTDALRNLLLGRRLDFDWGRAIFAGADGTTVDRMHRVVLREWDQLLTLLREQLPELPDAANAVFDFVLRHKGFRSVLQEARLLARRSRDERAAPLIREWEALHDRMTAVAQVWPDAAAMADSRDNFDHWKRQIRSVEQRLAEICRSEDHVVRLTVDRSEVLRELPPGAALIEFVVHSDVNFQDLSDTLGAALRPISPGHYGAFILNPASSADVRFVPLGNKGDIFEVVSEFRGAVARGSAGPRSDAEHEVSSLEVAGSRLSARIFAPLWKALVGCHALVIAPDGDLTGIPFEILPVADGGLVMDRFEVSYAATGRQVARHAAGGAQGSAPLVVAAPDFDAEDASRPVSVDTLRALGTSICGSFAAEFLDPPFAPLDGAVVEGLAIAELLGAELLSRRHASREAVLGVHAPVVLHIASHGYSARTDDMFLLEFASRLDPSMLGHARDPLSLSGIALAGANWKANIIHRLARPRDDRSSGAQARDVCVEPAGVPSVHAERLVELKRMQAVVTERILAVLERSSADGGGAALDFAYPPADAGDGRLSAADVLRMDLQGTELVVLSACRTGLGVQHDGDGIQGLCRSFLIAGAQAVVCSLWSVPDDITVSLMLELYRALLAGVPRGAAVHRAKQRLRQRHPDDPRLWAGFVLYGNPGVFALAGAGRDQRS